VKQTAPPVTRDGPSVTRDRGKESARLRMALFAWWWSRTRRRRGEEGYSRKEEEMGGYDGGVG